MKFITKTDKELKVSLEMLNDKIWIVQTTIAPIEATPVSVVLLLEVGEVLVRGKTAGGGDFIVHHEDIFFSKEEALIEHTARISEE